MKIAIGQSPWIVEEAGVSLASRSHFGPGILCLGTAALIVALPRLTYAQQFLSYTVRPGDTLSSIAARQTGDARRWAQIQQCNPHIRNAALIFPGQKLRIDLSPSQASTPVSQKASKTKALAEPAPVAKTLVEEPAPAAKSLVEEPAPAAKSLVEEPAPAAKSLVEEPAPVAKTLVEEPAPAAKPHKLPFSPLLPIFWRLLDIICLPLALFGARQIWLDSRSRKKRVAKPPIRRAAAPVTFWERQPASQESFSFLVSQ